MRDGLDEIRIRRTIPVAHPLDAERIALMVTHRDLQVRKIDFSLKAGRNRNSNVIELHSARLPADNRRSASPISLAAHSKTVRLAPNGGRHCTPLARALTPLGSWHSFSNRNGMHLKSLGKSQSACSTFSVYLRSSRSHCGVGAPDANCRADVSDG